MDSDENPKCQMDIPSFSTLWDTCETLSRLESSIREIGSQRPSDSEVRRKWRPQVNDNYYSDGICGVTFGIERPEFCHPLKTCCDHHFFTEEEFRRHEAQHIKCPHEECPVVIHPSVLNFHIETAHSPEVFARLNPVLADKSIVSWRDSRKKNYPTFERVQAKIRETGYRIQRGQVLLTKQFGSLNKRKPFELRDPNSPRVDKPKGPNPRPQDATSRRHSPRDTQQPRPTLPLEAAQPHAASSIATPPEAHSPQNDNPSSSPLLPPPQPPSPPEKSDSDMEEADGDPIPAAVVTSTATTNMPVGCLVAYDYDSDLSWDETLPEAATTAAPRTEEPKIAGDNSQTLEPEKSTPATTSLLDQLSSLKPKFSGAESPSIGAEQKEGPGTSVTANPTPAAATGRTRPQPSRLRRGRRQRGQNRGGRPRQGGDDSQSEGRGDRGRRRRGGRATTEASVEDEEGASGVTAIFASHPVVRMASKRRECMRNAALMAKRPTLLQMLLAEEMRHERNQLMQCVRFVVRNNFFR
nr:unnamed protein product [Spirometra erinaceieuropaei]